MESKKPSVIFSLLDAPAWGGAEEYVYQNLLALSDQHDVIVATNNKQVKQHFQTSSIKIINLPYVLDAIGNWKGLIKYFASLPHSIIWIIFLLIKLKHNYKNVICIFPGYSDRLTFSPIVKVFKCKLIWWEFGPLEPTFARNWGFPKLLFLLGKRFPDKIITISKNTMTSLVSVGKVKQERIQLIYPGTFKRRFKPVKTTRENIFPQITHQQLHNYQICCVGRVTTEKEFDIVIQAISKLEKSQLKRVHVVIIGDGPNLINLKRLTNKLKLGSFVTFTGFVSDQKKFEILSDSDIFVFPSAWELEGFGMTTIEAMMSGCAIITTGFGPQSEIIDNEKEGLYFKPKDPVDLAKKIEQLVKNQKLLKELQQVAYETAVEKFSLSRMQDEIRKLIQSVNV